MASDTVTPVVSPMYGDIGQLHTLELNENSVLIFQLNRYTKDLTPAYIANAKDAIKKMLPHDRMSVIIGCDVNIYELAAAEAVTLKLKGII